MKNNAPEYQFELLRARIESAADFPAVVVISSACSGDGKSVTASGLAESFSAAGYRTAMVDANHFAPSFDEIRGPVNLEQFVDAGPRSFAHRIADGGFDVISLTKESLRRGVSRSTAMRALNACRASYDVVVVDTGNMLESTLAMILAKHAQALILTVREGRSVRKADFELVKALEREEVQVLGTVSVSAGVIRDFAGRAGRRSATVSSIAPMEASHQRQPAAG